MRSEGRRSAHGFTLIEALAALTVLAVSLAAFAPSFGAAGRNFARLQDRLAAQQLAASLIEEHAGSRLLVPGVTRGRQGHYDWQVVVAPAGEELAPAVTRPWALFELMVVVDWAPQRRLQLQTLQLGRLP